MLEHHLLHAAVEFAQHLEDLLRLMVLRVGGEADDIGEQHGDILPADRAERLVVGGQLIDHVGREMPCQVDARALGLGVVVGQMAGARDDGGDDAGDDQDDHDVRRLLDEVDEVGIELETQALGDRNSSAPDHAR